MTIMRDELRTGLGYDSHRTAAGRPLILAGITVPAQVGLLGHSDADVLCHAVMDALLGAAHLGNIGMLFPDTDPANKDADSLMLLRHVAALTAGEGWEIENIDAVIILEQPKLSPYVPAMEQNIATACGIEPCRVSVKPKTNEGMDALGRGEGAAALVSCLLRRRANSLRCSPPLC
jgi:2-C-methyl-D-erythritol 2,4-cyclodiphosphate synthase